MSCPHQQAREAAENAKNKLMEDRAELEKLRTMNKELLIEYEKLDAAYTCVKNTLSEIQVNGKPYDNGDTEYKQQLLLQDIDNTESELKFIDVTIYSINEDIRHCEDVIRANSNCNCNENPQVPAYKKGTQR